MTPSAQRRYIALVVVVAGFATLGLELAALGLLAPYFGVSQPVWASVIGMTLLYLSIGYVLGGRVADRWPRVSLLSVGVGAAGLLAGAIPLLAQPILRWAAAHSGSPTLIGALFGMLALFSLPMIVLAAMAPLALRLSLATIDGAGRTTGRLYALSTVGSLLGTFVPTLLWTPLWGTRRTIELLAIALVLVALPGLWWTRRAAALGALIGLGLLGSQLLSHAPIRPLPEGDDGVLVHEEESTYNYVRVVRHVTPDGGATYTLMLNESYTAHSIYHDRWERTDDPLALATSMYWDYPAIAPFFYRDRVPGTPSLLMIGLGAGTATEIFASLYGVDAAIDAVEIDERIVAVARRYFGVDHALRRFPRLTLHVDDGRAYLNQLRRDYDVIAIDVYRWPYIAAHVVTEEAFERVRAHLLPRGVVIVKCDRGAVGEAIGATMKRVFPQVFQLGSTLVGVREPVGDGIANLAGNAARLSPGPLRAYVERALATREGPYPPQELETTAGAVLTDDRAPIELLVHQRLWAKLNGR